MFIFFTVYCTSLDVLMGTEKHLVENQLRVSEHPLVEAELLPLKQIVTCSQWPALDPLGFLVSSQ